MSSRHLISKDIFLYLSKIWEETAEKENFYTLGRIHRNVHTSPEPGVYKIKRIMCVYVYERERERNRDRETERERENTDRDKAGLNIPFSV